MTVSLWSALIVGYLCPLLGLTLKIIGNLEHSEEKNRFISKGEKLDWNENKRNGLKLQHKKFG